ncbi:MAG: lysoplasmalogenase [Ferruginibacter sp.]|nr:lysoplasmalogenase [Ferruginibacter sp.]
MKYFKSIYIFVIFFSIHLLSLLCKWNAIAVYTKPLLLLSLITYFLSNTKFITIVFLALVFSLLGDVLLIFQERNSLYFIFGLVAFLIAHICYIIYFLKIKKQSGVSKWNLLIILGALVYGVSLVAILFPKLGDMQLPVIVYAATICTMLIAALHIPINKFFAIGAVLFVISDSLLAINKFYVPFAWASFLIMLTYGLAQLFITSGVIKNGKQ